MDENKTVVKVISKVENEQIESDNKKLDEVLKDVKKVDETCDYKNCKQKTSLMGQTCTFCNHRFCYKHNLPEIHSKNLGTKCDEIVKKKERDNFLHPKIDTRSAKKKEEHDKAKKILELKLKQMQLERKQKQPGAGSSKKKK
ncbi:CLUMA_CG005726, isoform A [Clunio marinus]|uniref:CLUMA_CG005726, isoform A n=1 Tax=Clunio marinus TaxID=568069 RepID=A0A1J1HVX6_9DIPT|nr:CLUMA_CG005726, isoform A [Clunio marinus]